MIDYISNLLNFFYYTVDFLEDQKLVNKINKSNINVDFASKSKRGDVSSNFYLIVNKKIIDSKYNLKEYLFDQISKITFIDKFEISDTGFININFKKEYIVDHLKKIIENNSNYGNSQYGKNKKINIEFVSANPTGPITIAHLRGAVLGDVLGSILEKSGYLVTREYYVNDSGSQIDILANSLYKRYQQLYNFEINIDDNEYPGEYLIEIAKKIKDDYGDIWLDADKKKTNNFFKKFAIENIIEGIVYDLNLLKIKFDIFSKESEIVNKNLIEEVFSILEDKNLLYEGYLEKPIADDSENWESRKQLLFKSTQIFDDRDRAFKKANGEWTYFANDAAYHLDKYKRNFDKLINIWGADHIGYIPRMRSVVSAITNNNDYLDILNCQIVRLIKDNQILKMSKREGNFISLNEVFKLVGKDPLRYFMISTRSETSMDFDLNKVVLKNKDNPVFYCQYAYARASSVINKSKELGITIDSFSEYENIKNYFSNEEIEIILKLISYPFILYQSAKFKEPHRLINYIEDLSSTFHSFWNKGKDNESLRLIDKENITKTQSKLVWLSAFRIVLKNVFDIIKIEPTESM